jgi:hypothetical protein
MQQVPSKLEYRLLSIDPSLKQAQALGLIAWHENHNAF